MELRQVYERSLTGVRWGLASQLLIRSAGFASSIIVARLLSPTDFGLLGMAMTVSGIAGILSDFGLGQALVQCQENLNRRAQQTFWVQFALAVVLTAGQVLAAPLFADFYATEGLVSVLRVSALSYLIGALGSVSGVLLQKDLRFKTIYLIETVASFLRIGVTIGLAATGWGFWSVVYADLISKAALTVLRLWYAKWHPDLPTTLTGYAGTFKFGQYTYLTNLLNYLMNNMDFIILGKLYGTQILGPYYFAYSLVMTIHQMLAGLTGNITFSSIAALSSQPEAKRNYFRRTLQVIGFAAIPIYAFFGVSAPSIIIGVFGDKWSDAVVPFAFISIFGAVRAMASPFGSYSWGAGDARTPWLWHVSMCPILSFAIYVAAHFGVNWVAACTGVLHSAAYLTFAWLIARVHHLPVMPLVQALFPAFGIVVLAALTILFANQIIPGQSLTKLIVNGFLYAGVILAGWLVVARGALLDLKRILIVEGGR